MLVAIVGAEAAPPFLEQQWSARRSGMNYANGSPARTQLPPGMCPYPNGTYPPAGTICPWVLGQTTDFAPFYFDVPNQRYRTEKRVANYERSGTKVCDIPNACFIANVSEIYILNDPPGGMTIYRMSTTLTGPQTGTHKCDTVIRKDCPFGPCVQPNVTIEPTASDMGSGTLAGEPVEKWKFDYSVPGRNATREWTVQKHFPEGRNPMLLINNHSQYNPDCQANTGFCPEGESCPYHGPCTSSFVIDNRPDLVVGPPPDWVFAEPTAPFSCLKRTMEEYEALHGPLLLPGPDGILDVESRGMFDGMFTGRS